MKLTQKDLKELEKKSAEIVIEAGKYILDHWHTIHQISFKDRRDVATEIDTEVEEMVREKLHRLLPEAGFIVEEGKTEKSAEYNWVIDPIDGTKYFVNNAPLFLTQIALLQKDTSILGQVYNPTANQFFTASLGNGAFLNDQKMIDLTRQNINEAIIDVDLGGNDNELDWKLKIISEIAAKFYRIRVTGNFFISLPYNWRYRCFSYHRKKRQNC